MNRVSCLCPVSLDCHPPIYASHIARVTGMSHHAQLLLIEMGSQEILPELAWNHYP
jgi:hypothetical protein